MASSLLVSQGPHAPLASRKVMGPFSAPSDLHLEYVSAVVITEWYEMLPLLCSGFEDRLYIQYELMKHFSVDIE